MLSKMRSAYVVCMVDKMHTDVLTAEELNRSILLARSSSSDNGTPVYYFQKRLIVFKSPMRGYISAISLPQNVSNLEFHLSIP